MLRILAIENSLLWDHGYLEAPINSVQILNGLLGFVLVALIRFVEFS